MPSEISCSRRKWSDSTASQGALILGIDLGGTKVATGLVDRQGRVSSESRRFVDSRGTAKQVSDEIARCAQETLAATSEWPAAAGAGVAGQTDPEGTIVRYAPNLRWRSYPLAAELGRRLKLSVTVLNDVRAATLAELEYGSGKGCRDLFCVYIGTGMGGSVVSGGRLLEGASNAAGEVGHSMLVAGGRPCTCPNRGCLEAYVGGWAIAKRAREAVRHNPVRGQTLTRLAGGVDQISAATISEAVRRRDPLGMELDRETAEFLATGLAGLVNAFNPERVVLGGGVLVHRPHWVRIVERTIRRAAQPPAGRIVRVVPGGLGDKAVMIGAALMARRQLDSHGTGAPRHLRGT